MDMFNDEQERQEVFFISDEQLIRDLFPTGTG